MKNIKMFIGYFTEFLQVLLFLLMAIGLVFALIGHGLNKEWAKIRPKIVRFMIKAYFPWRLNAIAKGDLSDGGTVRKKAYPFAVYGALVTVFGCMSILYGVMFNNLFAYICSVTAFMMYVVAWIVCNDLANRLEYDYQYQPKDEVQHA